MTQPVIPVVLCVDVEPDDRHPPLDGSGGFEGLERVLGLAARWRDRIESVTDRPARFTWAVRMDPQIARAFGRPSWILDRHPELLQVAAARGDELGAHVHAYRWDDDRGWVNDLGDDAWLEHCVGSALEAHRSAAGDRCRTARFGDGFTSEGVVAAFDAGGVAHDLTLEPGMRATARVNGGEPSTGRLPDLRAAPIVPFRPAPGRPLEPAPAEARPRRLLSIPLSTAPVVRHGPVERLRGAARAGLDGLVAGRRPPPARRTLAPWALFRPPDDFPTMVRRALAEQPRPYLAFALRTGRRPDLERRMDAALGSLLDLGSPVSFCTASDAARALDHPPTA